MFLSRPGRALASIAVTLTLAATSLSAPLATFGAQAKAEHTAIPVLGAVSPGGNIAYDVHFKNTDTSNLAQFFLNAITPAGGTLLSIESASRAGCSTAGGDLHCTFGAVRSGDEINLRVVYTTPGSGATFTVPFSFTTTGVAPDKGKNSHGDDYPTPGVVNLNGSADFAGTYTSSTGQIVSDSALLQKNTNPQFTKVNAPAGAIGVTVGEVAGNTFACPAVAGAHCFGQWSVVAVNNGATYGGGFSIVLGYKGNIGNANFVHVLNSGAVETITATCTSKTAPAFFNCKWIETSGGNSFVTLWVTQNGRYSGY